MKDTLERIIILLEDNPKITDDSGMIKSVDVLEEVRRLHEIVTTGKRRD